MFTSEFHVYIDPVTLCGEVINIHLRTKKDRSRSSIFELEIHPWYKFGINATNID